MTKNQTFSKVTRFIARASGRSSAIIIACSIIILWGISGPLFNYSDTWQLVINTGTTIITFIMVFLIQNTQNRDSEAVQIKLDELIRTSKGAHTALLDIEELTQEEIEDIKLKYEKIAAEARKKLRNGDSDTHSPEV